MSFLDGLLDVGKSVVGFFSGNSIWSSLAKTAVMGYALNRLSSNANKSNDIANTANIDQGVRLQIPPASDSKIPVLYGAAFFGGNITDAAMTNNNKTMWYAVTLTEKTGTKLSDGGASTYTFRNIYWNDQRVVFNSDGITINYTVDRSGNIDRSLSGLVKIYCYRGSSTQGVVPNGYTNPSVPAAYSVFPNWTSSHNMSDLIFALVRVDYNREKNVTGIGNLLFHVENSMNLPGDVLYDYMKNTMYGASIPTADIDTTTLSALNTYSAESVAYADEGTGAQTLADRYQINGLLDTASPVLENVEKICNACATWLSYDSNEGKWGVIINKATTYTASFNDSNILGSIRVQGTGLQDLYNEVKVEFPHRDLRDSADFVKVGLNVSDYNANEVPNTLGITYDIINEPIQAQMLGFIELKQSRIDLIIQFQTDFGKYNLKPGDVIRVTNSRLAFTNKEFRILSLTEIQEDGGPLMIDITALEYQAGVYSVSDLFRYTRSDANGIITIGSIGIPGTPQVTKYEVDARPRVVITSTAPTGVVEGMEFWMTTDVTQADDSLRSYTLISTQKPIGGGVYTSGTTVTLDYDSLGATNFLIKTRGFNVRTVGPYSDPSGAVYFEPTQVTNAINADTAMYSSTGGLLTGLALVSLAQKLLDLFGGDTSKSLFDKIFDVFKDETGVDLVGQASGGSLVVASSLAIKENGGTITSTASGINFEGPFKVTAAGSDVTFKIKDGNAKNDSIFWDGSEWRIAASCCSPTFEKAAEPAPAETECLLTLGQTYPASNTSLNIDGCGTIAPLVPISGSYLAKFSNNKGYGLYGPLELGSGNIKLYLTDGTLVETVAASACKIWTDWVEIPFAKSREVSTDYYITIDKGCFYYCGCPNAAVNDPTTWDFTTSPYKINPYFIPPTQSETQTYVANDSVTSDLTYKSVSPSTSTNASGICGGAAELKITWKEKVIKGSGNIEIVDLETNSVIATKSVASAALEPEAIDSTVSATAKITSGKVTSVTMVKKGEGVTAAKVIFSKPATGEKAEGTAVISGGQITGITITYAGWGYTSAPTITITPTTTEVSDSNKDRVFNWGSISGLGLTPGKRYAVRVPQGAAIASRNICPAKTSFNKTFNFSFLIDDKLRLVSYTLCSDPHTNDTAKQKVNIRSNIYLKFNRNIKIKTTGPANATIYGSGLFGGTHQVIDLRKTFLANKTGALSNFNDVAGGTDSSTTVDETVADYLVINPTKPFKPGTSYYIQIPAGVIIDAACNVDYEGITDSSTVTWTTDSIDNTTPPVAPAGAPARRTVEYELGRPAVPGDGKVQIFDASGVLVAEVDSTDPAVTYQYG